MRAPQALTFRLLDWPVLQPLARVLSIPDEGLSCIHYFTAHPEIESMADVPDLPDAAPVIEALHKILLKEFWLAYRDALVPPGATGEVDLTWVFHRGVSYEDGCRRLEAAGFAVTHLSDVIAERSKPRPLEEARAAAIELLENGDLGAALAPVKQYVAFGGARPRLHQDAALQELFESIVHAHIERWNDVDERVFDLIVDVAEDPVRTAGGLAREEMDVESGCSLAGGIDRFALVGEKLRARGIEDDEIERAFTAWGLSAQFHLAGFAGQFGDIARRASKRGWRKIGDVLCTFADTPVVALASESLLASPALATVPSDVIDCCEPAVQAAWQRVAQTSPEERWKGVKSLAKQGGPPAVQDAARAVWAAPEGVKARTLSEALVALIAWSPSQAVELFTSVIDRLDRKDLERILQFREERPSFTRRLAVWAAEHPEHARTIERALPKAYEPKLRARERLPEGEPTALALRPRASFDGRPYWHIFEDAHAQGFQVVAIVPTLPGVPSLKGSPNGWMVALPHKMGTEEWLGAVLPLSAPAPQRVILRPDSTEDDALSGTFYEADPEPFHDETLSITKLLGQPAFVQDSPRDKACGVCEAALQYVMQLDSDLFVVGDSGAGYVYLCPAGCEGAVCLQSC